VTSPPLTPFSRSLSGAAASDRDAASLLDDLTKQRQQGQRLIARSLARAGTLAPHLRERDAADVIHALLSPELYRLLVVDRGWSPAKYEEWLTGLLVGQLLATPCAGITPTQTRTDDGQGNQAVLIANTTRAID